MADHDPSAGEDARGLGPDERSDGSRTRRALTLAGPVVLVGLMVVTAILAAISVTPERDDEALARPADADLVLAGSLPASWDPARIADAGSAQMLAQVYEGLTVLDAEGRVRPALAESWTVAADGRSIRFELRPDLRFSDGTPIEAEDVRRSWLRVLDPASPSPLASMLDPIVGASAYASGRAGAEDVGIRAEGDVIEVAFSTPAAYFPAVAAVATLAVVPPTLDGAAPGTRDAGTALVSSGAYRVEEVAPDGIRLAANDDYWGGEVAIERVTVVTDDGGRSSVDVFEDGAVDWTTIGSSDASWIRYDRELGPQLRRSDDLAVDLLAFDTSEPPFDDALVRRAVGMAVDWRRLGRADEDGVARATSLLPPGIPGRTDADLLPPHDPEAARRLLAEAGFAGGAGLGEITLATYGVGETDAIAAELADELGLDVVVERRPFGEHSALLDIDPPDMWTLAWSADFPHAHDFLGLLLRSDSTANAGGWSDARFDALIDEAAATDDPDEQARLYEAAGAIVRDEVPLVPLAYGQTWALGREGLAGADPTGVGILRYAGLAWQR